MRFTAEDAITQIDAPLTSIGELSSLNNVGRAERIAFVVAGAATLQRLTPSSSPYRRIAEDSLHEPNRSLAVYGIHGALRALRAEYESGYAVSLKELVHADVFGDFIAMAQELIDKDYKDAAAVIVGSVLEGHLRQLSGKHGLMVDDAQGKPKKSERLNADLVKSTAYGSLEQKQVTA